MPFGLQPECVACKTTSSPIWKKNEKDEIVCNACSDHLGDDQQGKEESGKLSSGNTGGNGSSSQLPQCHVVLRKSTRAKAHKQRVQQPAKSTAPKGKGRRIIFKKSATKAPSAVATPVTTDSVFYKGTYYQIGDIVSMIDVDGDVYYAQIRGLLQDQYCEKSAVITWLIPTESSPKDRFDPATYILGPEEEVPRKLECMEFVSHAPSEYFKAKNSPYPTIPQKPELCFIWTRLRPQIKPIKSQDVFS